MNRYEAYGLCPEQVKKLTEIAVAYTAAGWPRPVDDLVAFAFSPTKADLERLAKIKLPKQPWPRRICWWLLDALDALDALRRLLRSVWAASAVMCCPENYLGGNWEPGACEGCRAREGCRGTVVLP